MKYLVLLVLCSTGGFNGCAGLLQSVEDYYWRDYNGIVPTDAVEGGKNKDDQITYIGQMSLSECSSATNPIHTTIATITNGNQTGIGTFRGKVVTSNSDSNLKVLCSSSAYHYGWYFRTTPLKPGCRYVVAGFEDSVPLYVGRAEHDKQSILGKIFSDGRQHYTGLIIAYQGEEYLPETYAILAHCS